MGLIIDTCVFVRAERTGVSIYELLGRLRLNYSDEVLAISVITLLELGQGQGKAAGPKIAAEREYFIRTLRLSLPAFGVDDRLAMQAGALSSTTRSLGHTIGFADTLIAATAQAKDFGVLTYNVKHFTIVPACGS